MKKILVVVFAAVLFSAAAFAQSCSNSFVQTFDSGGGQNDEAYSLKQTSDGGYIIVGNKMVAGAGWEIWAVKTDSTGVLQFQATFGGNQNDVAYDINQTTDGGYIIAGQTKSFLEPNGDVWIIKTNSLLETCTPDTAGNCNDATNPTQKFMKTFGGTQLDSGFSVQQATDSGYIIGGYTGSFGQPMANVWLIKTDASGNQQYQNPIGGNGSDYGYSVQQTTDGGYAVVGSTNSFGASYSDVWLVKTDYSLQSCTPDATGNCNDATNPTQKFMKTFSVSPNTTETGWQVRQANDGGYIITGDSGVFGAGNSDVWLIKTNASGNMSLQNFFTSSGTQDDRGYAVQQTTDGGYIIAGITWVSGTFFDVWIIKTDSSLQSCTPDATGNCTDSVNPTQKFIRTYGAGNTEIGQAIVLTNGGGYAVAARYGGDFGLIKTDSSGNAPPYCTVCGNNLVEAGEQCDDGVTTDVRFDPNNDGSCVIDSANPSLSCKAPFCGDGYLNQTGGEQCDDGATANGDGCSSACQFEAGTGQGQNILEVKITKITNQNNEQTDTFSDNDTANIEVKVTNFDGVLSPTLTLVVKAVEGGASYPVLPTPEAVSFTGSGTVTKNYSFVWAGKPNGSYEITARVPPQTGEKNFAANNMDNKFISLVQKKGSQVAVPETNLLLAPLVAFAAVVLVYFSSRR